ncbi:MAG: response regulator transcription factor [Actinomycetales bacterium]|nr:response regulator transcription factor [Actinomycetales bacterium]
MTQRSSAPVRVLVADRQPLFRRGVADVLAAEPDLAVVGETDHGSEVLELVGRLRADVVLLDLGVPGGGVEACAVLRATRPDVRVVVLTDADDDAALAGAVRAGARGYLLKDTTPEELVGAVRAVASGSSLLSPAMASRLLDEFAVLVRRSEGAAEGTGSLSRRELEVLTLVAQGLSNRAIAESLFISENTVKNHIRNIHEKLQVHSRMEAVVRAVRDGVLQIA